MRAACKPAISDGGRAMVKVMDVSEAAGLTGTNAGCKGTVKCSPCVPNVRANRRRVVSLEETISSAAKRRQMIAKDREYKTSYVIYANRSGYRASARICARPPHKPCSSSPLKYTYEHTACHTYQPYRVVER